MKTRSRIVCACLVAVLFATVCGELSAQASKKVDLNQADVAELDSLPGIGPAIAERILEYREENGPFQRIEELMNVFRGEERWVKNTSRHFVEGSGTPEPEISSKRRPEPLYLSPSDWPAKRKFATLVTSTDRGGRNVKWTDCTNHNSFLRRG
jgi:competence protein ComEA